jgi:hypothetical protein
MAADLTDEMLSEFPLEENYVDHSGHPRRFRICVYRSQIGSFHLVATNLSQADGYRFEV